MARGPLGVVEVLVVAAESVGRFGQAEGAKRPGGRWRGPKGHELGGTRLSVSHPGLQNEGARSRRAGLV